MKSCKSCRKEKIEIAFDVGNHPISSRYLKSCNEKEELYSLKLGQCMSCGMVQLMALVPIQELQLIYEWITYNEPEEHLDDVVYQLSQLEGINTEASILGISHTDDTTLARFGALGFSKTEHLSIPETAVENIDNAGIEVIQNYISSKAFSNCCNDNHYDIILIRHILENTYNPGNFLK